MTGEVRPASRCSPFLFNNAHVELARIGDPKFHNTLRVRLAGFAGTIPPYIEKYTKNRTEVVAATLVGSSSAFQYYHDLDVNIMCKGKHIEQIVKRLPVIDESGKTSEKNVCFYFINTDWMDSYSFVRFWHSKPLLMGDAGVKYMDRFKDLIPGALADAARGALRKAEDLLWQKSWPPDENLRKSSHYLETACRYIYSRGLLKKRFLGLFPAKKEPDPKLASIIRAIHEMDNSNKYAPKGLLNMIKLGWGLNTR